MSRVECIRYIRRYLYSRHRALRTMVRVAGQNGRGPINLFKKHDANHLMRPGRRAERNAHFSLALQIGRKSVRASDHENCVGDPLVSPLAELPGESRAIDALAVLVQRHQHGFLRYRSRNRRGLLRYPGRAVARAAFRNFMNREAAKAELAADVPEALAIAFGQFLLRALLQPAD